MLDRFLSKANPANLPSPNNVISMIKFHPGYVLVTFSCDDERFAGKGPTASLAQDLNSDFRYFVQTIYI